MKSNLFITAVVTAITTGAADAQEVIILDPIIVNAGQEKVASDVPQSVSSVDEQALAEIQAGSIGDVLDTLPGIAGVGSSSILGQSFNIRGVGAGLDAAESSILTLVDGEELYYESYRQGSVFTEPDLLKRVEVLRGPGYSTLYGSGALGGVILMETKDAADFLEEGDTFAVRQKLSFESNPDTRQSTTIVAFKPDDNFDALFALSYRDVGVSEDADGNTLIRTNADIISGLAKLEYNNGPHRVAFSYNKFVSDGVNQDFNQLNGASASPFFPGWGVGMIKTKSDVAKLEYGYNPDNNRFVDLTATVSYTNSEKDIRQGTVVSEPVFDSLIGNRAYGLTKLKLENLADISGDANEHYLTVGAAVSEQDRTSNPSSASHAEGKTNTYEIYALSELIFNDKLTINTGLRIDHQKVKPSSSVTSTTEVSSETAIEPQIAAIYALNDNWNVFGSISRVNRLPTVDEMYDTFSGGGINLDLKPEKGMNYELGFSFTGDSVFNADDQATVKLTAFHANIKDKIDRFTDSTGFSSFQNQEEAKIKGIEIEGSYGVGKFNSTLGVTYIEGEDENGDTLDTLANNSIKIGLGYQISDQIRIGSNSIFAKSRTLSDGEVRAGFGVHNMFIAYTPNQGMLEGAELRLAVDNAFDKQYTPATYLSQPAEGRNLKLSIAKTF